MATAITYSGETLIAQKQAAGEPLIISKFILAHVPDLNPNAPVNRAEPMPENVVHEYIIPDEFKGYVNPNQVVYSMLLTSNVGNFTFNWVGLVAEDGTVVTVTYLPEIEKFKTANNIQGNNLTRNVLLEFSGAQEATGITVEAKTWQIDFTARFRGIDERERLSNRDLYGRSCFFNDGFSVVKEGSSYVLKSGFGYVEGIRCVLAEDVPLAVSALPKNVFVDVSLQQQGSDVVPVIKQVLAEETTDFEDANLTKHYLIKVAEVSVSGVVTDARRTEAVVSDLVEYLKGKADSHSQDKDDPHETMKTVATEINKHASRTDDPHGVMNKVEALLQGKADKSDWVELMPGKAWKRPDGIIEQVGTITFPTDGDSQIDVTFPVKFPNEVIHAHWSIWGNFISQVIGTQVHNVTTTGMTLLADKNNRETITVIAKYFAFGR